MPFIHKFHLMFLLLSEGNFHIDAKKGIGIKSYFTKNKKFFIKKFGEKIIIYNFAHYFRGTAEVLNQH